MGKDGYTAEVKAVVAAVCAAFVVRERRDRLTAKPDELFDKLCHTPDIFDQRSAVPIPRNSPSTTVAKALRGADKTDAAFYLGSWGGYEIGLYTVDQAVEMVEQTGGALAALSDACRVFYKSEDGDRFFLATDAEDRKRLMAAMARTK